jgi:hypothetical protein
MTTSEKNLPSYEQLFSNLNFKVGDEARSVYSPAAYLTDLIQLLQDYFESPNQALDSARQIPSQETQATTNDGHPWHTLRHADGSWTGLGDVQSVFAIPGP